ncbi:hypothetical protein SCNRRL3882_4387 [Streptomyces chartreusis NRRL 3882]|uniref:Uncharacterized protein n=1 Tax=Streptomyces chartreusis NRRL 3882 TaxID=1079985 RepID=A0A2N9BC35_STRCX|nr:hypothetical protein SCNRRL3882_4387 [Streptomyces chartreusis NRRL 3882]
MVVKVGYPVLPPPGPQFPAGPAQAQRRYSAPRGGRGGHTTVQQVRGGARFAQPDSGERLIGGHDRCQSVAAKAAVKVGVSAAPWGLAVKAVPSHLL